jgi:hypothetical protein
VSTIIAGPDFVMVGLPTVMAGLVPAVSACMSDTMTIHAAIMICAAL